MKRTPLIILSTAIASMLSACGGSTDANANVSKVSSITIPFQAKAGATDINCGATLTGLGTSGDSGRMSDFAFYVHDVEVTNAAGNSFQVKLADNNYQDPAEGVALLDFQNKTDGCAGGDKPTNMAITGDITGVDVADITGVSFKVGVPASANHHNASTEAAPYNRSGLFWKWQSGHKFLRTDIKPSKKVAAAKVGKPAGEHFLFHIGSTGCVGDPSKEGVTTVCSGSNRPAISLNGLSVDSAMKTSPVVLDYAKMVSNVDINKNNTGAPGCMSGKTDTDCAMLFANLGMDLSTGDATGTQTAFRIGN